MHFYILPIQNLTIQCVSSGPNSSHAKDELVQLFYSEVKTLFIHLPTQLRHINQSIFQLIPSTQLVGIAGSHPRKGLP